MKYKEIVNLYESGRKQSERLLAEIKIKQHELNNLHIWGHQWFLTFAMENHIDVSIYSASIFSSIKLDTQVLSEGIEVKRWYIPDVKGIPDHLRGGFIKFKNFWEKLQEEIFESECGDPFIGLSQSEIKPKDINNVPNNDSKTFGVDKDNMGYLMQLMAQREVEKQIYRAFNNYEQTKNEQTKS